MTPKHPTTSYLLYTDHLKINSVTPLCVYIVSSNAVLHEEHKTCCFTVLVVWITRSRYRPYLGIHSRPWLWHSYLHAWMNTSLYEYAYAGKVYMSCSTQTGYVTGSRWTIGVPKQQDMWCIRICRVLRVVAHLSLQSRKFTGEVLHQMFMVVVVSKVHVVLVYFILHV